MAESRQSEWARKNKMKPFAVTIHESLKERFRCAQIAMGLTRPEAVRQAVREFVEKREKTAEAVNQGVK